MITVVFSRERFIGFFRQLSCSLEEKLNFIIIRLRKFRGESQLANVKLILYQEFTVLFLKNKRLFHLYLIGCITVRIVKSILICACCCEISFSLYIYMCAAAIKPVSRCCRFFILLYFEALDIFNQ